MKVIKLFILLFIIFGVLCIELSKSKPSSIRTNTVQAQELTKRRHTVTKSDTLGTIATLYGISWEDVAQLNNLEPPYTIHIGQKLELPALDYEEVITYMKALNPKLKENKAIALAHIYNVTAAKYDLPAILIVAIAWQENRFRYSGIADNDIGHMQLNFYWQVVRKGRVHKYSIEELDNNYRLNIDLAGEYLQELKTECTGMSLPYWVCYNASIRNPKGQAKYHDLISTHMAKIRAGTILK